MERMTRKEYYRRCCTYPNNIVEIVIEYVETRTGPEFSLIKRRLDSLYAIPSY